MKTQSVRSPDGTRIAYAVSGEGPALFLLHGGGQSRRNFHEAGYIQRLQGTFPEFLEIERTLPILSGFTTKGGD